MKTLRKACGTLTCLTVLGISTWCGSSTALAEPLTNENAVACESFSVTVAIPRPNPYDEIPAGKLPEPSGEGFTVKLERIRDRSSINSDTKIEEIRELEKDLEFTQVTGSSASTTFSNLPSGVYLISTQAPKSTKHQQVYVQDSVVYVPLDGDCEGVVNAKIRHTDPNLPPTNPTPSTSTKPTTTKPTTTKPTSTETRSPQPSSGNTKTSSENTISTGSSGSGSRSITKRLADTGASVIAIAVLGLVLLALGVFMLRKRNNPGENE